MSWLFVVLVEVRVLGVPIMFGAHRRKANRSFVTQREIDSAVIDLRRVVAHVRRHQAIQPVQRRLAGDDVHRSRGGVTSIQRSLRAAQHFDAFEIEHRCIDEIAAVDVVPVDVEDHRLVASFVVGVRLDATHREADETNVVDGGKVRCKPRDVREIGDAGFFDLLGGKRVHRDRYVLDILLAVLSGDDDFLHWTLTLDRDLGL